MREFQPVEAFEFLKATPKAVLLDVRSFAEYWFVGHPIGALNAPWSDEHWNINEHFLQDVQAIAPELEQPLVLICRSGKRTLDAGRLLQEAGYSDLTHVLHGFEGDLGAGNHRSTVNGWRHDGLPWEQG
jgi:rhodanese-related sulfurtransferase